VNLYYFFVQHHAEILELTTEHLWLVGVSTLLAVLIGIPLGIISARWPAWNKPVLGTANIIQTIPSLALFGFLLPVPWLGDRADRLAILALTLYALLPVIRNTYTAVSIRRWWKRDVAWASPRANYCGRWSCRWHSA
jgi:osmoprotectant transport system permease protein